ncbi:MAG: hypothetical protein BGO97_12510 [Micrococcales bacterium 70-64]|nr:hypothetical protein [Leifsonia sp.]ODU64774.1 MAG: hypothetical protein ABT06_12510 [Leifsonia sp. SCN 70-46]OJX86465.1 MAG: hypothetical protein BGO97_12510 [Micrococcales bacterium 70-64]
MADEPTAPVPPPASDGPVPLPEYAAPEVPVAEGAPAPAPAKRPIWPFVLGGAVLLFILAIVGVVIAVLAVFGAFGADPSKTVLEYDRAFETADCALFQKTLSDGYEQAAFGGELDCAAWTENAENYTTDGTYAFTVRVQSMTVDGDAAQVVTHETDTSSGSPQDYDVRYYLVKENGDWVIDDIVNETE